jgi:hypothetical protein
MLHRRRREACLKSEPRVRKDYTIAIASTQPFFAEQSHHAIFGNYNCQNGVSPRLFYMENQWMETRARTRRNATRSRHDVEEALKID